MSNLDRIHRWLVHQPLLATFTVMTRILLGVGFLPSGLTKVLGNRFTQLDPETSRVGLFFEGFFQAGEYYAFVGFVQVLAGLLLLIPRTAFFGALLYLPVIANIFVITVSVGFRGTWIIAGLMLLATLFLLAWDYDRMRSAIFPGAEPLAPDHRPSPGSLSSGCSWRLRLGTASVCMGAAAGFFFAGLYELPALGYCAMAVGMVSLPFAGAAWWRGLFGRALRAPDCVG